MKRQSSVVQNRRTVPGSVQNKISRSWNNEMPDSQHNLVSAPSQRISPRTVKIDPDFGNLYVVLENGCSNDNIPSAMNTSTSHSVSFTHTSKGQLKYNRHETLSWLENFCSVMPLSPLTVACMDEKKAKEDAALAELATEESKSKAKMLIMPKSDGCSPKRPIVSLPTHEDMMLEVKEKFEDKHREYLAHDKLLGEKAKREFEQSMQELSECTKRNLEALKGRRDADAVEVERQQQELLTAHKQHAKILAARMHQADQEARQIEEQRKLEVKQKQILAILKEQENVRSYTEQFSKLLSSCQYPQHLSPEKIQNYSNLVNNINKRISTYLTEAQNGDNSIDTDKVRQYAEQAKRALATFVPIIEEANKKGEKEMKRCQEEEEEKKREAEKRLQQAPKTSELRQQLLPSSGQDVPAQVRHNSSSDSTSMANVLASYLALQEVRKTKEQNCSALLNDSKLKQYRFDLQIAINTPLNSISTESGSHLLEKIVRLNRLLSGETVEVSGRKVSTRGHEAGATFARDLLAKQLVKNGDTVASSPESAFAIASVGVMVWCEHKEVGDLILAYFHLKCPYTVPYYIPKGQESSEEYFKSLGYICEDGKVEEQDKFLKRMSGYIILYAAIMVSSPLNPRHPHPHGLEHAWQWLGCLLNYDPRPDITATVLFSFLDVAGHSLMNCYGRQFGKLLRLISDDYMPRIVDAKGASGPVTRLQGFLNEALRTGRVKEPKGFLRPGFWNT